MVNIYLKYFWVFWNSEYRTKNHFSFRSFECIILCSVIVVKLIKHFAVCDGVHLFICREGHAVCVSFVPYF